MKWLLIMLMTVRVTIPMGTSMTFKAKRLFFFTDSFYHFEKDDGTTVRTPIMWTIVTEEK